MFSLRVASGFALSLVVSALWSTTAFAQKWKPLASQPADTVDTCMLLTDGTVMCIGTGTNRWHRLRPDQSGSYLTGSWDAAGTTIPDMPPGNDVHLTGNGPFNCVNCTYAPTYFGSAVLPDGRAVVIGGELVSGVSHWTNIGFIYDPFHDAPGGTVGAGSWSNQLSEVFGGGNMGDVMGIVLQNGTFVLQTISSTGMETLNPDPAVLAFTMLTQTGKLDAGDEEGWSILPDGTLITVDATNAGTFELFDFTTSPPSWSHPLGTPPGTIPNMPVNLADTISGSAEVGPAVLRADGKLVYFSGNLMGRNALYDTNTGTWSIDPNMDFPADPADATGTNHFSVKDGPASLLPNGNVLVQAAPVDNRKTVFQSPSHFYEIDFATNKLTQVDEEPGGAAGMASFQGRMLLLPTGEVLFSKQGVATVELYTNGGTPQDAWRPVITSAPTLVAPGSTNTVAGTLFNGFSEGAAYGDDAQMASNYPLVRIRNTASTHVAYCRTHDHSRMGVERVGSTEIVTTMFDAPPDLELGASTLVVVVNGIPSQPVGVTVSSNRPPVAKCKDFTAFANAMCLGSVATSDVNNGSSDPDGDPLTFTLNPTGPFGPGSRTVTLTVTDPSGLSNSCTATVTVVDNTPPKLTVPSNRTVVSCGENTPVTVGQATATDNCVSPLTPTGQVIAKNGVTLTPPIPVVGGQVTLGIGTFTIEWSVSDGANPPVTANQTVIVGVNMQASQSFLVDDRGQVQNSTGGFAAVLNSGSGLTQVGNDARSGGVLSVAPVRVLHRAIVNGGVTSASTVFKEGDGTITGTITAGGTVVLPPLPTLPAFPAATAGSFTVNSGTTQTRAPGSYQSGTVNGGTLILAAGDYFFRSLAINSGSTVRVTPTTRIFVRDSLTFNASFRATSGTAVQAIFLGYAGTADLGMFARFDGTLVAPNATVRFGTGSGLTFIGSFFARVLEVTPASTLVCRVN